MQSDIKLALTEDELRSSVGAFYRMFLGREADPEGLEFHVDVWARTRSVQEVLKSFLNGDEFKAKALREAFTDILIDQKQPRDAKASPEELARLWSANLFPEDYRPPGEAGRSYLSRLRSGFLHKYCSGPKVLDVGFTGYDNPERKAALPAAIGVDLDFPGYDGVTLPFESDTIDTVFSSHCLEHILFDHAAIRDWHRVLKVGGFIVCMVPSQALYEKKRFLPSKFNPDHKRLYTPGSLAHSFETALETNSYRVRHLAENDQGFDYTIGADFHSHGCYEIEIVIEKIVPPAWRLT